MVKRQYSTVRKIDACNGVRRVIGLIVADVSR